MPQSLNQQGGSPERKGGIGRWARRSALTVIAITEVSQGGPKNITPVDVQSFEDKHPAISQPVNPNQAISQAQAKDNKGLGSGSSHQIIDIGTHSSQTVYSGDGNLSGSSQDVYSPLPDGSKVARSALNGPHGPNTAQIQSDRQTTRPDFGQPEIIKRGKNGTGNEIVDAFLGGLATIGEVLENIPLPVAAACSGPTKVIAQAIPTPTREIAPAVKTPVVEPVYGQLSSGNRQTAESLVANLKGPIMTDVSTASPFEVTVNTMKMNAEKILRTKGLDPERYQLTIPISDFVLQRVNDKTYFPPYILIEKATGFNYVIDIQGKDARLLSLPNNAGIVYAGDIPVVGVKGVGVSDLTGKPQGDRAFMFPAMAMVDYSNVDSSRFGSDQTNQILSQQNQIKQFVWDTLGKDSNAEFNFLASADNNGRASLIAEVFINGVKHMAVQKLSGDFVFVDSKYLTTPGRRLQLDNQGYLHSIIAGKGANEGEEFDEGIFNPETGQFEYSEANALLTPTPTVTAAPTRTNIPTPSPTAKPIETPTATATVEATRTPTATPTSEITPVPMKVAKEFNLTSGDVVAAGFVPTSIGFQSNHEFYKVVQDPIGKFDGQNVIYSIINGPPPDTAAIRANGNAHRPYEVYYETSESGPWALEFDQVLKFGSTERYPRMPNANYLSVVSAGISASENLTNIKVGVSFVNTGNTPPHLELYQVRKGLSMVVNPSRYNRPVPYVIGERVKIRLEFVEIDGKPTVRFFQNNIYIDEVQIDDDAKGFSGRTFRTSLYAGPAVRGPLESFSAGHKIYVPLQ